MDKGKIILRYQKLPQNYFEELSTVSKERYQSVSNKLKQPWDDDKHFTVFVSGTAQPVFKMLQGFGEPLKNFWGIDFEEFFAAHFDKTDFDVPNRKFVFIYNVGLERALNTAFSSKMLQSLIKKLSDAGSWVFIETHLTYTKFYQAYEIEITNKLNFTLKKEESFL